MADFQFGEFMKVRLLWCAVFVLSLVCISCGDSTPAAGDASDDTLSVDTLDTSSPKDDGNPDTKPETVAIECGNNSDCSDGLFCNGAETCNPDHIDSGADGCLPGVAPKGTDPDPIDCFAVGECDEETDSFPEITLGDGDSCDDGIACTADDQCNAAGECSGTIDHTLCDDGVFCNGVETCTTTVGCAPGTPPAGVDTDLTDCLVPGFCDEATKTFLPVPAKTGLACNDGVDCTFTDACTGAGVCQGVPDDSFCTDSKFCNGLEVCDAAAGCKPGSPPTLTDGIPCTNDSCDENAGGVVHTPNDGQCTNGNFCDGVEVCDATEGCKAGTAPPVDDGIACTVDSCDEGGDTAVHSPDNSLCTGGTFCTGGEVCDATQGCQAGTPPTPPADPNPNDCIAPTTCDDTTSSFLDANVTAGTACNDDNQCTESDACDAAGTCGGTPVADNTACDDGDPQTNGDECVSGVCTGESPTP
jgi:hypothetical protein